MLRIIFFVSICTSIFIPQALLAESYWGAKVATVSVVDNSAFSNSLNVGVFLGADFTKLGSNPVALEADISSKISDGKISGTKWNIQSTALYAAMRTGDSDYFKFKLGAHSTKSTTVAGSGTGQGLSYGFGVGFDNYVIEYTVLMGETSSDSDFNLISFGYQFN